MSKPYRGSSRQLILAFDVGTTFSGISYSLLDPGEVPKIFTVTRYPGQEHAAGTTKVPSIIYYDLEGRIRAAGAEALLGQNVERAEDENWMKAEWFKVRLRPQSMPSDLTTAHLPPLPLDKSVLQVVADLMEYLMLCAELFIRDTHPVVSSDASWQELRRSAIFIISHPNGWEGPQQIKLRHCAVMAKLVPDSAEGRSRIHFVSEGEASLHYCLRGGFVDGIVNKANESFIIADLGGGTLDFSAYKVTATKPLRVEEVAPARSVLEGSTFVTRRATALIRSKLEGSFYGTEDHIHQISDRFDETTKKTFRNASDVCLVPFGSTTDRDLAHGIRSGKLKLTGEEVAALFESSLTAILNVVSEIMTESQTPISSVYLVGGFSASPYLIIELRERLAKYNILVTTPDGQTAKAVSDGSVSFYLDHFVSSRVARVTYGVISSRRYIPGHPEHESRLRNMWTMASGESVIAGGFFPVVLKGTVVSEEKAFKKRIEFLTEDPNSNETVNFAIAVYRGLGDPPDWTDQITDPRLFKRLFYVTADSSARRNMTNVKPQKRKDGSKYWNYSFDVIIYFGGPEVKAQISWTEKGVVKKSPAQLIYDSFELSDFEDDFREEENLNDRDENLIPAVDQLHI